MLHHKTYGFDNFSYQVFDQFDEIPPFITSMIKPRISSANKAPYLLNDHHEKVKNLKKTKSATESSKMIV
jgi:hypothetical protein